MNCSPSMLLRASLLLAFFGVVSCGHDRSPPEPTPAPAPLAIEESSTSDRVPLHDEVSLGDGISRIEERELWIFRTDEGVVLQRNGIHEWWNAERGEWVASFDQPSSQEDDDAELRADNRRLARFGLQSYEAGAKTVSPSGRRYLFTEAGNDKEQSLVVVRDDAHIDRLPQRKVPYATFPQEIVALGDDDVWVFARTVSGKNFGDDFPGCPITVRHSQDGGYLAHFDGARWTEFAWPQSEQPLAYVRLVEDQLIVITGKDPHDAVFEGGSVPPPQRAFRVSLVDAELRWAEVDLPADPIAERLGWQLREGHIERAGERVDLKVDGRVIEIVPVDRREAFVEVVQQRRVGEQDIAEFQWLHVRR